jgi:hypothetical protein
VWSRATGRGSAASRLADDLVSRSVALPDLLR